MYNAGHRKGATAGRCVVKGKTIETEELPAYCAVTMAGLDDLPDTIMTRAIVIRMRRRAPSEPVEPWRHRVNTPEGAEIRGQLTAWADAVRDAATGAFPDMPKGVTDRNADKWEPLLAVADLAGGHWPATARVAAVTDVTDSRAATPSIGVQLLRDLRTVFTKRQVDRLASENALTDLKGMEEAPWSTIRRGEALDARGLAQRLRKYGIKPSLLRIGENLGRGYERSQFLDAWSRYLPDDPDDQSADVGVPPQESVTSVTSATSDDGDDGGALFDEPSTTTDRRCSACGVNRLMGSEAIRFGTCRPCRDKSQSIPNIHATTPGKAARRPSPQQGRKHG